MQGFLFSIENPVRAYIVMGLMGRKCPMKSKVLETATPLSFGSMIPGWGDGGMWIPS